MKVFYIFCTLQLQCIQKDMNRECLMCLGFGRVSDELDGFEEVWKGKARKHLPGWTGGSSTHEGMSCCHHSLIYFHLYILV